VAVRGWTEGSGADLLEVLRRFEDAGVEATVITQINVDGTLEGPDVEGLAAAVAATSIAVIASGGVGTAEHLRTLAALEAGGRRLAGAIVGKAIYEGTVTVEAALSALRPGANASVRILGGSGAANPRGMVGGSGGWWFATWGSDWHPGPLCSRSVTSPWRWAGA
jgi:imidazole glycerol phosphate synthase subunit HisF